MESKRQKIIDVDIHYQVCGRGPSALLLIHGAVGSTQDFALQMADEHGLDKEKFTIIALDLPGYGQSGEAADVKTEPTHEYFAMCAQISAKLMERLNFKTYSVGGWSDGARVASVLAIKHQSRVNALLLWGFVPVMDKKSCHAIARTRDTSAWDPQILSYYNGVYGEQKFSDMWKAYVDFIIASLELPDQFDIRDELRQIKCPTWVLHGADDPIVDFKEHVKPIEMQIYDSEIFRFKGVAHNVHQAHPEAFNQVLTRLVDSVSV